MTFAVIKTGGKQYRVREGDILKFELLGGKATEHQAGDSIVFDQVLLVDDGTQAMVGTPTLKGASVTGEFIKRFKGKKLRIQKFKAKSNYDKVTGHRQQYDQVKIVTIKT